MNRIVFFVFIFILLLFENTHPSLANATGTMHGAVTGVITDGSGRSFVQGWACAEDISSPVVINVYADQAYPKGTNVQVTGYLADLESDEPGIAAVCQANGKHNFSIQINPETIFKQGGQPLYVYALSPTDLPPLLLSGAGSFSIPAYNPAPANPKICTVLNGDPNHCFLSIANYDELSFASDFTCTTEASCCPKGNALIPMNGGVNNKVIEGNGYTIHRMVGQSKCPVIQIFHSNEVLIDKLNLNEEAAIGPCGLSERCANTIQIQSDTDIKLNKVNIYHGKGYVVSVVQTNGFSFNDSAISESGIIGLYVGLYGATTQSTNVAITDSVFARSRTNGVALQGVSSNNPSDPILVTHNIFNQNHWHGLWPAGPPYPATAITTGGELLIAVAQNVRVASNIIADAYCQECYSTTTNANTGDPVLGIEIGQSLADGVSGLMIDDNYFYNGSQAPAIHQNAGTTLTSVSIIDNNVVGWQSLTDISIGPSTSGTISGNHISMSPPIGLSQNGTATYAVLREQYGIHWEAKVAGELPGSVIEGIFGLSSAPRPGAPVTPLYRCFNNTDPTDDYLAYDENCYGKGTLYSIAGYSFNGADRKYQSQPFYECNKLNTDDQFISWDSRCEGQTVLGVLGNAVPYSWVGQ